MSEENVEVVRRVYEAFNAGEEPSASLFRPEAWFDALEAAPDMGVGRNRHAAWEAMRLYIDTFEDFHVELEEVIHADGERVVTAARNSGRIKGSGAEVRSRFFHVVKFDGGKIASWSGHTDRTQALDAAGLRE